MQRQFLLWERAIFRCSKKSKDLKTYVEGLAYESAPNFIEFILEVGNLRQAQKRIK
jgi:hypothetical protein